MSLSPINAAGTAANPVDGLNTVLEYSTDGGTTWHQIANLTEFKNKKRTRGKKKTTTHSTTGAHTYAPMTLSEPGESEFACLYDKTAFGTLNTLMDAATVAQWRCTLADAATEAVSGYLSELGIVTPLEDDATIEGKITHSGTSTVVTS